jgi:hypothetical protein
MPSIENATAFLLRHSAPASPIKNVEGNFDLPIDRVTDYTVRLIIEKYQDHQSATSLLKEVEALIRSGELSREEKEKLNLIVYQKALDSGEIELQTQYAKKLKYSELAI